MSAARRPVEACIELTFGGLLTFDEFNVEAEVAPEQHRAWYFIFGDGSVCITRIEHNESRLGKRAVWVPCQFPRYVAHRIKDVLEQQIESERDIPSHMNWDQIAADEAGKSRWGEL